MAEKIKILLFGVLAQKANAGEVFLPFEADTNHLLVNFGEKFPELAGQKFTVAINKKIISGNTELHEGDEIALLPPFSGG
jgi:molybdopterin converting factor small subunit